MKELTAKGKDGMLSVKKNQIDCEVNPMKGTFQQEREKHNSYPGLLRSIGLECPSEFYILR